MRDIDLENKGLPQFCKHENSDQHYPLQKLKKTVWLRNYPWTLRVITCMAKSHDSNYLHTIMKLPYSDTQYAMLMHYHKMAGLITRPPAARKYRTLSTEEKVKAFNMYQEGHTVAEIIKELDSSRTNIYKILDGIIEKHQEYKALSYAEKQRIYILYKCGTGLRQIAKKLNRAVSTVKYQVDKLKLKKIAGA